MTIRALCQDLLDDKGFWKDKNVLLPQYDRKSLPVTSIAFSAGRMAYGHTADILQDLLNSNPEIGLMVGVKTHSMRDYADIVASDYLMTQLIYENEKDKVTAKIQGAMKSILHVSEDRNSLTWQKLREYARSPFITYATINAPEGAYGMSYSGGDVAEPKNETVKKDLIDGTIFSDPAKWAAFLRERFEAGLSFSMVSCTNFSGNGFVTRATLATFAKSWEERGFAPKGFYDYVLDQNRLGCPNTMIDRIAVAPNDISRNILTNLEICSPMVVTEKTRYWVLEDCFPAGRPDFDKADGVIIEKNYDDVKKYEEMKLRMLNMAHSTIAGIGVLLGYRGAYGIYNAMRDADIRSLISKIIDIVVEIVDPPRKMDPRKFAEDTFTRLDNPNIPDDPMRIAFNGSIKMQPRFMDTFFDAREKGIHMARLNLLLVPVAGFIRYAVGVDDKGEQYSLEDDPIKDLLLSCSKKAHMGDQDSASVFSEIIARKDVMGKNLYADGDTGRKLQEMVGNMLSGPGAVRQTLKGYLSRSC